MRVSHYKARRDRPLEEGVVRSIRDLRSAGDSYAAIARKFGLSVGIVKAICQRKTYQDID
jgi:DNA invertase Pin-like site-specific DNA recombinase